MRLLRVTKQTLIVSRSLVNLPIVSAEGAVKHVRKAIVLLGGGIDSTTLIPYLQNEGLEVEGIHFDYGQPAARMERKAVESLARHYRILCHEEVLRPSIRLDSDGFRFRNGILVLVAGQFLSFPSVLAIGIHAGTPFFDCSSSFFERMSSLVVDYTGGTVRLVAPWLDLTKRGVIAMAKREQVPLGLTYSCQIGNETPCGACLSCKDREGLA